MQKERSEQSHQIISGQDKFKQLQKSLASCENERRILSERLDGTQNIVNDLRRSQQSQQDNVQRLQEQAAEMEVQKSALESQLRIAKWSQDTNNDPIGSVTEEDLNRQLINTQREKAELKGKVEALSEKVRLMENEKNIGGGSRSKFSSNIHFDRPEKNMYEGRSTAGEHDTNRLETESCLSRGNDQAIFNCGLDHAMIEQENRDLRLKVRRLETLIAEKESELARVKSKVFENFKCLPGDLERNRAAQLQAERLLDAREQSHRQQVLRLENQV